MSGKALNPGDQIEGDKIVYSFGKVTEAKVGLRTEVTLGLNGKANVAKRWEKVPTGLKPADTSFDELLAKSARGECDTHEPARQKVSLGKHRAFTGVLKGGAVLKVTTPA